VRNVFADRVQGPPTAWQHDKDILNRSGERRAVPRYHTVLRSGHGVLSHLATLRVDGLRIVG
jgi:hypothetical protein